MLKKIAIVMLAGMVSATSYGAAATKGKPNTDYIKKGILVLSQAGYKDIKITGQQSGYCTIAKGSEYDWSAADFTALSNDNVVTKGVVCLDSIYITKK